MKKKHINKETANLLIDNISNFILNKYLDRKGFYKLYKRLKNDKSIGYIKQYFEQLDKALIFLTEKNNTPENLFKAYVYENLKDVTDEEKENFCIDIYYIIIQEYPKSNWKIHEIAELFYAHKPSSKNLNKYHNNYLKDITSNFEQDIAKAKKQGEKQADELLKKYTPEKFKSSLKKTNFSLKKTNFSLIAINFPYKIKTKIINLIYKRLNKTFFEMDYKLFERHFIENEEDMVYILWKKQIIELKAFIDLMCLSNISNFKTVFNETKNNILIQDHFLKNNGDNFKANGLNSTKDRKGYINIFQLKNTEHPIVQLFIEVKKLIKNTI